jgi:hypothetical protein
VDIENTVLQRCIELGLPTSSKSIPVGRDALVHLNAAMLSMPSTQDQRSAIEFRAALNMTFSATGRGGECAFSKYSRSHWDSVYHSWVMDWYCKKTNAVKQMSLFCDAEHFEIDVFHSMACYWVLSAGSTHMSFGDVGTPWIFPWLKTDGNKGVSSKLSTYLKRLASFTDGSVPEQITAKSLRVGSVNEILARTGDICVGTIRGGWGRQVASMYTLSIGGKAVTGWCDPRKPVHPPSCEPILGRMTVEADRQTFTNFVGRLLDAVHFRLLDSHLKPLAFTMVASLLQYLRPFIDKYSDKHVVVVSLLSTARTFGYSRATLLQWGEAIHADWQLRNVMNVDTRSDLGPALVKLQTEIVHIKQMNEDLLAQNKQLAHQIATMQHTSCQLHSEVMQQFGRLEALLLSRSSPEQEPGNKRARPEHHLPAIQGLAIDVPDAGSAAVPVSTPMLRTPSPLFRFLASTTLYDLYIIWYERKYTLANTPARWDCDCGQSKFKLNTSMRYTEKVLAKPEHQLIRQQLHDSAPANDSALYRSWCEARKQACIQLVEAVKAAVSQDYNGKSFNGAPTISSLDTKFRPEKKMDSEKRAAMVKPKVKPKVTVNVMKGNAKPKAKATANNKL